MGLNAVLITTSPTETLPCKNNATMFRTLARQVDDELQEEWHTDITDRYHFRCPATMGTGNGTTMNPFLVD